MKTILAFLAVLALTLGGCATAPKEHSDLMTRSLEQAVRMNEIKLSKACTDAQNKAIASARYKATSTGLPATAYPHFYQEPACVVEERTKKRVSERVSEQKTTDEHPVVLPENVKEIMKLSGKDKGAVERSIAAKGVAAVIGDRDPTHVAHRYEQLRGDAQAVAIVKEYRRFRWNDLVRPIPWNGYTSDYTSRYPYSVGPVPIGIEIGIDTGGWSPYGRAGTYPNDGVIHPRIQNRKLGEHFKKH